MFTRRFDLSFSSVKISVVFCHCILSFYCVTRSTAIFSVIYQRYHIMPFASVMSLCHSLLSSSFGCHSLLLNLLFTVVFCHRILSLSCHILYPVIVGSYLWVLPLGPTVMWFCNLHLAFDMSMYHLQSMCRFASVILFCHALRSFLAWDYKSCLGMQDKRLTSRQAPNIEFSACKKCD